MKRVMAFMVGSVLLFGMASCYLGNIRTGGLSMSFSGITPRQAGEVVRVYLLADGLLFSTVGGTPFAAEVTPGASGNAVVKIDGLPVGPTYKALVGYGLAVSGVFQPSNYGESGLFQITPGGSVSVDVTLEYPAFSYIRYSSDLMSKNIKAVGNNFSSMFAAEDSKVFHTFLYYNSSIFDYVFSTISATDQYDLAADPSGRGVSSYRINGLSVGSLGNFNTWLDTKNGIVPFTVNVDGAQFQTDFTSKLTGPQDILQSGTFPVIQDYALFFLRANGLGGSLVKLADLSTPANWSWVNQDVPGLTDMALGAANAFFASSDGAFALPPAFFQDPVLSKHRASFSAPALILSLGVRPGAAAPGLIYMGTTDGVWYMSVDEGSLTFGNPVAATQIPETAGERIEQIALSSSMVSSDNQAYLSRYYLFIRTYGTVKKLPFFAVFPGKPTGLAWDPSGVLYVSGTEGLSAVYVGGS